MKTLLFILLSIVLSCIPAFGIEVSSNNVITVNIFEKNVIHFTPDSSHIYNTETVISEDNGRVARTDVVMPKFNELVKLTAKLTIHPIPETDVKPYDPWDRAGSIRLSVEGYTDIELIKFITSYGGETSHEADISHLAPLLKDKCTFKGFIDTWISPGWKIDFDIVITPDSTIKNPDWAEGLMYKSSYTSEKIGNSGLNTEVTIPEGLRRVKMHYFASGHCTDGTTDDEFITKDHVISVDGVVVFRFRPWRDDCKDFRAVNPYTRKWTDGWWSSDYSRSGWCPGDIVEPLELDLTDHLTPGKHIVRFLIEDVRPRDENDHYGFWRISSHLFGWEEK